MPKKKVKRRASPRRAPKRTYFTYKKVVVKRPKLKPPRRQSPIKRRRLLY